MLYNHGYRVLKTAPVENVRVFIQHQGRFDYLVESEGSHVSETT